MSIQKFDADKKADAAAHIIALQNEAKIAACERQVNELAEINQRLEVQLAGVLAIIEREGNRNDQLNKQAEINKELLAAVKMLREEFAGFPHSLGYHITHLPKIDEIISKAEK